MTDAREAKLPKWAQTELHILRRDVEGLTASLRRAVGFEPTSVVSDPFAEYYRGGVPRYLNPEHSVRFKLTEHDYIDVRLKGAEIELMASGQLVLTPQVTNVVRVGLAS